MRPAKVVDAAHLFELFPAFMLILTIVMGVALFVADRRARRSDSDDD